MRLRLPPGTGTMTRFVPPLLAAAGFFAALNGPLLVSAGSQTAARIEAARLLDAVRALTAPEMEGRLTGTPGSGRARRFIADRFRACRLDPVQGAYLQPFDVQLRGAATERLHAANVWGMIPGRTEPDRFVLITAHYDHMGIRNGTIYPGADDNASGVAAMLALAEWFSAHPPGRTLLFVAFDAEEQGLRGSRHFVANPPIALRAVVALVNLDMLARGDRNELVVAGTSHYPQLKPAVAAAAAGRGITVTFGHDRPAAEARRGEDDWTHLSDHAPFHLEGVPFLYFGVHNHADYHKPTDTAERIPAEFYGEAVEVVLGTVERLAGGG